MTTSIFDNLDFKINTKLPNSSYLTNSQFEEIDLFFEKKYNSQMDTHNELVEEYVLVNTAQNEQTTDYLMGKSNLKENKRLESLFNQTQSDLEYSTSQLNIIQLQKNAFVKCYSVGRDISYLAKNYFKK